MPALDPQLRKLLTSLRGRVRRYIVADSLLALVAFIFAAFWIGLAIDFIPVRLGGTEMPRSARTVLLAAVGIALIVMIWRLLVGRLQRPLPDDSLALLVERHHPEIGGRLVTAVQLEEGGRLGDAHSPALLRRVHAEAAAAVGGVDSNRIFRWQPLIRKIWLVVPMVFATIAFAVVSPSAFGRAAGRLLLITDTPWPRQAALEMVGVELPIVGADEADAGPPKIVAFENGVARLPRGSSGTLRVLARAEGAIVPEVCTVYFTTDGGIRGQANMRRVGRVTDGYQAFLLDGPPLAGLTESVSITVRGLDARLDDYRIEAVEPPALSRLQVVTTDPSYLRPIGQDGATTTRSVDYQAGLRVREGARAELRAKSSVPLGRVDARMLVGNSDAQKPPIKLSADGTEFSLVLEDMRQPATIIVVPEDRDGISAQVPYRYFLGVVTDEKPEIELRLKGIGTAVTRNARLPIYGTAKDDYEIEKSFATLSVLDKNDAVAATDDEGEPVAPPAGDQNVRRSVNLPIRGDRDGKFELTIDLRDLAEDKQSGLTIPEPGGAINVIGEASDRYDLDGRVHRATSQLYKLDIVTPENLLALLERRELALRSRLEQTIEETRQLRDSLGGLKPDLDDLAATNANDGQSPQPDGSAGDGSAGDGAASENTESGEGENETDRQRQIVRLRTQQIGLQAAKTSEELQGIATSLDDLLEEMANNRVDSIDRSERIGGGVRDPLRAIVAGDLTLLRSQISGIEKRIASGDAKLADAGGTPTAGTAVTADVAVAVETSERVLLQLTAVLEKMLDLESFNEILDMVRELIDSQEGLIEKTKKEQKTRVLDLFD